MLTAEERQEPRRDMAESPAREKTVLKCRQDAINQKNFAHGIDDGIDKANVSN